MGEQDFKALRDGLMPILQRLVEEFGMGAPVAAVIDRRGRMKLHAQEDLGGRRAIELNDEDFQYLRARARSGGIRAARFCSWGWLTETETREKGRAIFIFLEHCDGTAIDVAVPVRKGPMDSVVFDDPHERPTEPRIFANTDRPAPGNDPVHEEVAGPVPGRDAGPRGEDGGPGTNESTAAARPAGPARSRADQGRADVMELWEPDFNALLARLVPQAKQMVRNHGHCGCIAMAPLPAGNVEIHTPEFDAQTIYQTANTEDLAAFLLEKLVPGAAAGRYTAVAADRSGVVTLLDSDERSETIRIDLEHQSGKALLVLVPHRYGLMESIVFDEMIMQEAEPRMFVPQTRPRPG